jgi:tellurite resistance protein TerC
MSSLPWIGFVVLVLLLLALDLGVLNRKPHEISVREAVRWTALWVLLAFTFNVGLGFLYEYRVFGIGERYGLALSGKQAALQFFTAYLVEEALSIDNLFVMAMVFQYFGVPQENQHRVLFFGILGALVFRGLFIGAGLKFIEMFEWSVYLFGALLVYTALRMLLTKEGEQDIAKNPLVRMARRFFPLTDRYHGNQFFVRTEAGRMATPLFMALIMIEASDIVFAVDSVPAVFGVTRDPFLAYTSNVFAILGLRSLYFALAAALRSFRYIKVSLVLVLGFVGAKMLLTHHLPIGSGVSLGVIIVVLGIGIVASLTSKPKPRSPGERNEAVDSQPGQLR